MTQITAERVAGWSGRSTRRGAGLQRFVAGWAALGMTLSGATQLRLAGLPVGPSELMMAAWILFVGLLLLRGAKFSSTRVFAVLGVYWLGAFMLLALGTLVAVQTGRADLEITIRDGMAFVYVGTLTIFLALPLFDNDYQYHRHFARLTFLFHAVAAGLLLGLAIAPVELGLINLWYYYRFRGWSENPNQMALTMAAMPFLGWWLSQRSPSGLGKAACALGIALCFVAGLATYSDGLRVAWIASFGAIGALLFYRVTRRGRSRWMYISHVMIPALVVVTGVFYGGEVIEYLYGIGEGTYAELDQGEKRLTLWLHGIEAIRASPLFGFGPGAFSGTGGPFEGDEAHNSFIDWGMSTGLTGVLLCVAFLGWVGWRALRSRETTLVGMWMSVVVFSIFGYMLRHPYFWMVLVLVLTLSERSIVLRRRQAGQVARGSGGDGWRPMSRTALRLEQNRSR